MKNLEEDLVKDDLKKDTETSVSKEETLVFDPSVLVDNIGDEKEIIKSILDVFLEDLPSQINFLRDALETEDFIKINSLAHSIKGASFNVGAYKLAKTVKELELYAAENKDKKVVSDFIDRISVCFADLSEEIKESNLYS